MAQMLRRAAVTVSSNVRGYGSKVKLVDIPRVHGATVKMDPKVEAWVYRRENLDHFFRWNKVTTSRALIWVVGVPFLLYAMLQDQQVCVRHRGRRS